MHWHERLLEESKTFGGLTGVDTIELPNKGLLGGIDFTINGVCGVGADDPDVWLWDRLTKIEVIVNGSQVILSVSGEQLLALMLYKGIPIFTHDMKNMNNASCEIFMHIPFGRFWHDTEYLLDLSKVTDPEIRLTYAFATTSVGGWTNGTAMTATPSRKVVTHLLIDGPTESLGYIKTSELYRFTSGSAKKENMMIPRGPTYSNLYVQSWYKQQGWGVILDKLSLNLDMGDKILFHLGPNELSVQNLRQYGRFRMSQQFTATGQQSYPIPFEQGTFVRTHFGLANVEASAGLVWANYGTITMRQTSDGTTAVTGPHNIRVTWEGIWPFSVLALPNFDPKDERTRLDTSRFGDVMVRVEEAAAGAGNLTIKLLGDEVVTSYL